MKFGLFGGATARSKTQDSGERWQHAPERFQIAQSDDSHAYGEFVDAIVEAEALGFHSIFLVEHHFTGVAQVSASLNLLTFLAARTSTIRLGTGVSVPVLSNGLGLFGWIHRYAPISSRAPGRPCSRRV